MNSGEYTGDASKVISYLFGEHWKNKKGFKVLQSNGQYNHRFGGEDWILPRCSNCKQTIHQIFTFDLADPRLEVLNVLAGKELPLVSCLNCSSSWEKQIYKMDFENKKIIEIYIEDKQHWVQDEDQKTPTPLPRYEVDLKELAIEDNPIDEESYYRITNEIGEEYLCRVLGAPVFMQFPIDIECPICQHEMIYVATIFSQHYGNVPIFRDVDFFLGEMSLYYHICPNCKSLKVECQGT